MPRQLLWMGTSAANIIDDRPRAPAASGTSFLGAKRDGKLIISRVMIDRFAVSSRLLFFSWSLVCAALLLLPGVGWMFMLCILDLNNRESFRFVRHHNTVLEEVQQGIRKVRRALWQTIRHRRRQLHRQQLQQSAQGTSSGVFFAVCIEMTGLLVAALYSPDTLRAGNFPIFSII